MENIVEQEIKNYGGIENYLYAQQYKTLLRFLTCGSVDDGKSTLIGRLLYDSSQVYDDQLSVLYMDTKQICSHKNALDLALLVDGLQSERVQGITIDVAYRYFFSRTRKFIIVDTPGHEEYTKNMITGASNSDLAILLVDASKGIRNQTRRHWFISVLMGIRYIIVAINKMDLVNYSQEIFQEISKKYLEFNKNKLFEHLNTKFIPISALDGDNIINLSKNMSWYNGPTLFDVLENITVSNDFDYNQERLRFPIQYVIRNNSNFRGYAGTIAAGSVCVGQCIKIFPSDTTSSIKRIIKFNKDCVNAFMGESIVIVLEDDVDLSRGDILIDSSHIVNSVQNVLVNVVWMKKEPLKQGQYFDVKITTKILRVQIKKIYYKIDIHTFMNQESDYIPYNGIGLVELLFEERLIVDQYLNYPITGSMIFIDILSNETVGVGMISSSIMYKTKFDSKKYSEFELQLYSLIRYHFPHWNIPDLL